MQGGLVTHPKHRNSRGGGQHSHFGCGQWSDCAVTSGRESHRFAPYHKVWGLIEKNERAIRQTGRRRIEPGLLPLPRSDPGSVKRTVQKFRAGAFPIRVLPEIEETRVVSAPTFGARAMTGCQGNRFIEEEKFGIAARRHDRAPAVLEGQTTRHPVFMPPASPAQLPLSVMQYPAIAHELAACGVGDDVACRHHAVL